MALTMKIARFPLEALEEAWEQVGGTGAAAIGADVPETVRVIILGDVLPALIERRGPALGRLSVVASADSEQALRKKLGEGLRLETVWGVGYRLD